MTLPWETTTNFKLTHLIGIFIVALFQHNTCIMFPGNETKPAGITNNPGLQHGPLL